MDSVVAVVANTDEDSPGVRPSDGRVDSDVKFVELLSRRAAGETDALDVMLPAPDILFEVPS